MVSSLRDVAVGEIVRVEGMAGEDLCDWVPKTWVKVDGQNPNPSGPQVPYARVTVISPCYRGASVCVPDVCAVIKPRTFYHGVYLDLGHYLWVHQQVVKGPGYPVCFPQLVHPRVARDIPWRHESLDSALAPRRSHAMRRIMWIDQGADREARQNILYGSEECPEGEYLLHNRDGWTAISWWDRHQGDTRGNCNGVFIMEGDHDGPDMEDAMSTFFYPILDNLHKAGITLRQVTP